MKDGHDLIAGDGGVERKKCVDGFSAFEEVNEALDWDAGVAEAGDAAETLGIDPDGLVEGGSLQVGHMIRLTPLRNLATDEHR